MKHGKKNPLNGCARVGQQSTG